MRPIKNEVKELETKKLAGIESKHSEISLVPSVDQILKLFAQFKSNSKCEMHANYLISQFNQMANLTEAKVNDLSTKLEKWLELTELSEVESKGLTFTDLLYKASLTLASEKPRNTQDLETLDPITIKSESKVVTSDRYQFDINFIVKWINEKGSFNNPYTGTEFKARDQKTIKDMAKSKGLKISIGHEFHVEEHPLMLSAAIDLAVQVDSPRFSMIHENDSDLSPTESTHSRNPYSFFQLSPRTPAEELYASLRGNQTENAWSLHSRARSNPAIAAVILKTPTLLERLLFTDEHKGFAVSEEMSRKLHVRYTLTSIAKSHPSSAELILQTPSLREKIFNDGEMSARHTLSDIAKSHPSSAKLILQTPSLREKIFNDGEMSARHTLDDIANSHPASAEFILQTQFLREMLLKTDSVSVNYSLKCIAKSHPNSAIFILKDQSLREKLLDDRILINFTLDEIANTHSRSEEIKILCNQYKTVSAGSKEIAFCPKFY